MALFSLHIDRHLPSLASGTLAPHTWRRVVRHARACARCGPRYERLVLMQRTLRHGRLDVPVELEVKGLVDGPPPVPRAVRSVRWVGALGAVAALGALAVAVVPREDTWQARGDGVPTRAVVRVFCAEPEGALRELGAGGRCPAGAALALAAGAEGPLTQVAVGVRGEDGAVRVAGPFDVGGVPGREGALDVTPRVPAGVRTVELVVAFGASGEAALAGARGETVDGVVVVRQVVEVGP